MSTSYTVNIQVNGGNISADHSLLTADSVEYIVALFNFDESWNDLYKTAVFRVGELVYHIPLEKHYCRIPFEALKEPIMYISVFGVLDTTRATTAELPIQIQNSGYMMCVPAAPTPDPYNYFIEKATNLAEQATAALEEILSHKKFLEELSVEVQNNAATAFDAAERAETTVMTAIANHNNEENTSAHPNILKIANDAKNNFSDYYTKAEIDAMLASVVSKEE